MSVILAEDERAQLVAWAQAIENEALSWERRVKGGENAALLVAVLDLAHAAIRLQNRAGR